MSRWKHPQQVDVAALRLRSQWRLGVKERKKQEVSRVQRRGDVRKKYMFLSGLYITVESVILILMVWSRCHSFLFKWTRSTFACFSMWHWHLNQNSWELQQAADSKRPPASPSVFTWFLLTWSNSSPEQADICCINRWSTDEPDSVARGEQYKVKLVAGLHQLLFDILVRCGLCSFFCLSVCVFHILLWHWSDLYFTLTLLSRRYNVTPMKFYALSVFHVIARSKVAHWHTLVNIKKGHVVKGSLTCAFPVFEQQLATIHHWIWSFLKK